MRRTPEAVAERATWATYCFSAFQTWFSARLVASLVFRLHLTGREHPYLAHRRSAILAAGSPLVIYSSYPPALRAVEMDIE